jgi:hypothetical protein
LLSASLEKLRRRGKRKTNFTKCLFPWVESESAGAEGLLQ